MKISDATLRDTAHMGGVHFDEDDARVLAELLCAVGVDIVEAGIVSANDRSEVPLVQAVVDVAGRDRTKTVILARSRAQVERRAPSDSQDPIPSNLLSPQQHQA